MAGLFIILVGFGFVAQTESGWQTYFYLSMGIFSGVAAGHELGILNKRITIYNILKKLSNLTSFTEKQ